MIKTSYDDVFKLFNSELTAIEDITASIEQTLDDWGLTPEAVENAKHVKELSERIEDLFIAINNTKARADELLEKTLPATTVQDYGDVLAVNDDGEWQKYFIPEGD